MDQVQQLWIPLAILVTIVSMFALIAFFGLQYSARQRNELKKLSAALSMTREHLDRRIEDVNSTITESAELWFDKNHLLAEAQSKPASPTNSWNEFFRRIGVREKLERKKYQVFVLMPFLSDHEGVMFAIREASKKCGLKAVRSDESFHRGNILAHIIESIMESEIIICDVSSGNPNVYYELGIAHALNKSVLVISKNSEAEKLPFDINSQRIVFYKFATDLVDSLESALRELARNTIIQDT